MKKILIASTLLAFLIGSVWYMRRWANQSYEEESQVVATHGQQQVQQQLQQQDQHSTGSGSGDAVSGVPNADQVDNSNPDQEKKLPTEDKDRYQAYFQESEKAWEQRMEEFFVKESGLGQTKYESYMRMREGYEKDKIEAFQEHHEFMKAQYGNDYTYRPSSDEQNFAKEVTKRYEKSLQELIGDEQLEKYRGIRSQFNDGLKKDADPELGHMVMEF